MAKQVLMLKSIKMTFYKKKYDFSFKINVLIYVPMKTTCLLNSNSLRETEIKEALAAWLQKRPLYPFFVLTSLVSS